MTSEQVAKILSSLGKRKVCFQHGDKVSCSRCDVCWITSIVPKRGYSGYNGEIEVRINPAKKDGTRSNREFVLWSMEVDSIKKID